MTNAIISIYEWLLYTRRLQYIAFLITISSCGVATLAQKQKPSSLPVQPVLLFQKTPCLGTCPAYNATLYTDGSVAFVPFERGAAQDTLLLQIPEQEFIQLKQQLQTLHYRYLQGSYRSQWSDMPSAYFTFYENGRAVKRVRHQEGGPEALVQLKAAVGTLLERLAKEKP
ncbi:DUF6438 domain-containing protein [Pontibacter russatus]|uniref:DUF6438 domain-containing protein n=1 Tax=Pontibacter russatus TaxID=2694929 RepID=UPI001379D842|nr:DUF6438 domain-containing protein [Pontibacter russatus]